MSGELSIPYCLGPPSRNGYLVHRSKVGSIVAGCIGTHPARGKVKCVEHVLSWSLDSKQLPLPLLLITLEKKSKDKSKMINVVTLNVWSYGVIGVMVSSVFNM